MVIDADDDCDNDDHCSGGGVDDNPAADEDNTYGGEVYRKWTLWHSRALIGYCDACH